MGGTQPRGGPAAARRAHLEACPSIVLSTRGRDGWMTVSARAVRRFGLGDPRARTPKGTECAIPNRHGARREPLRTQLGTPRTHVGEQNLPFREPFGRPTPEGLTITRQPVACNVVGPWPTSVARAKPSRYLHVQCTRQRAPNIRRARMIASRARLAVRVLGATRARVRLEVTPRLGPLITKLGDPEAPVNPHDRGRSP